MVNMDMITSRNSIRVQAHAMQRGCLKMTNHLETPPWAFIIIETA